MTEDRLIQHRLQELEKLAAGWRAAERRVDTLSIGLGAVEKAATEIQADLRAHQSHIEASLARLHERLDESLSAFQTQLNDLAKAEAFEDGKQAGTAAASSTTWKVIAWSVMATIAFGGLVVAVLNLVLPA